MINPPDMMLYLLIHRMRMSRANAVFRDDASSWRNLNLQEIKECGRMQWQKQRHYGQRNYSELGFSATRKFSVTRCMHGI